MTAVVMARLTIQGGRHVVLLRAQRTELRPLRHRNSDARLAAQLKVEVRVLRRWRREAAVAGLIDIGASSWSIVFLPA